MDGHRWWYKAKDCFRKHPATPEPDHCEGEADEELCDRCGAWANCEFKKTKGDSDGPVDGAE